MRPILNKRFVLSVRHFDSSTQTLCWDSIFIAEFVPANDKRVAIRISEGNFAKSVMRSSVEAWNQLRDSWRTIFSGPQKSKKYIRNLAFLQGLDEFGGGFVVLSLLTSWFYQRYHVDATFLGPVFFGCNVIAALSFVLAPFVVKRIGLLNSMVFTHLPCSVALCLLPFLPSVPWAAGLLLIRSLFSSMGIPAGQAYTLLIVSDKERPAAASAVASARAVAQGISPCLTGFLISNAVTGLPLVLAGAFKSVYDVCLYHAFKHVPFYHDLAAPAPLMESSQAEEESRNLERVR